MNKVVVAVGYLMLILSVLWLIFVAVRLLTMSVPAGNFNDLEKAYHSFRTGLARDFLVCSGFAGAVAALFGWLLVLKKKVLKCNHCGAEVPVSLTSQYENVP
jgi:hypothetical protein